MSRLSRRREFAGRVRAAFFAACIVLGSAGMIVSSVDGDRASAADAQAPVISVDVDGDIDAGMAHRIEAAVDQAKSSGAQAVLLSIATNGGSVDDANAIKGALEGAGIKTIAFVPDRAWSAGALIALVCDKIVMAPGSSMGATLPIELAPGGGETPVDAKMIAAIRSEMESLAEQHHRDPKIAAGMVDPNVVIPGLKKKGEILSLTPADAIARHFIDGVSSTDVGALAIAGIKDAPIVAYAPTLGEGIAQWASDPIVSGLLLSVGFLGLWIELQTRYFIAGIIAVLAFGLYFGAHIIAGASTPVIIGLFVLGVIGVLFELHILPGHGVGGILGSLLIMASIVLAFGVADWLRGIEVLAVALIASIAIFILLLRWLPESAFMRRFAFAGAQSTSEGYVAAPTLSHLVGHEGVSVSQLRPAGFATIDGQRYEVQTEGDFIPPQTGIRVDHVAGSKIFVKRS
ncbi:MAG TPA: NfeD family protein [Candidatus Eremiobacteraceae bacterium]|nr:NfeD family protein [Candidatus Eremiobacteraceae bacterium]